MPTVTEKIALARENRDVADNQFREALKTGRGAGLSWRELATASGLSMWGVRYIVLDQNKARIEARKGEANV